MSLDSIDFHGCRLACDVSGSGPPVVFIQGVGVHGRGWAPQIDDLRSTYQCLSFDNRGIGRSQPIGAAITVEQMAEDALAVMDHLGFDSAHLVGHSLGGPIALQMALTEPARVRSLSLLCTVMRGRDATRLTWRILSLGIQSRVGSRASRRRAFLRMVMPEDALSLTDTAQLASDLEPLFGHDLADQPPVAMKQLAALRAFDATDRVASLAAIPTLVVSAAHDPIAPPVFGRALAAAIPGARYVEFADASHGLPIQHPSRVNALIREHLAAAEAARPSRTSEPMVIDTAGFAMSDGRTEIDRELICIYCVDKSGYCLGLARFPGDELIEVMVLDQVVHKTRELTVELSRTLLRLTLSPEAAAELDGIAEYLVPLIDDDEDLRQLDAVLTILFEGGQRGAYVKTP